MTKEIKKQFFLIQEGTYSKEIDFGIIHMSEEELEEEGEDDMTEYVNKEFNLGNNDFWTHIGCTKTNTDKLFFLASAITNELNRIKSSNYLDIIKYSIDIIVQAKELDEDSRRDLVEEVGKIAKNIKRDEDERNEGEETE